MSDKLLFGNYLNPIRLLKDNSSRRLINDMPYLSKAKGVSNGVDLGKIRGIIGSDSPYTYVLNVISNPNLDALTIRLACFLFDEEERHFGGKIYSLTSQDKMPSLRGIGEFGGICVGSPRTENMTEFETPLPNLLKLLRKFGITMTREQLLNSLVLLHDFYYLTVTDICYENSHVGEHNPETKKVLKKNSTMAYIEIPTAIKNKCIAGKWSLISDFQAEDYFSKVTKS